MKLREFCSPNVVLAEALRWGRMRERDKRAPL